MTYSAGWAMVTGASSGLGKGFASRLAASGMPVVLVARNAGALDELAAELRGTYDVEVAVIVADLTDPDARAKVIADLETREVEVLINNAGFATTGDFADEDPVRIAEEISLNCLSLTLLARAAVPGMVARGRGAIVNVASTAAFQPIPTMGVYAATKAYVLRLSLAMWEELRPTGVTVMALCPGATETAFWKVAGNPEGFSHRRTVDQVVDTCMTTLAHGSPVAIDGALNAITARLAPVIPVRITMAVARILARRP